MSRIFAVPFNSVYPLYVAKLERKGRTRAELDEVIEWLTGFDGHALRAHLAAQTTFEEIFAEAHLNPDASLITGVICGVRAWARSYIRSKRTRPRSATRCRRSWNSEAPDGSGS